MPSATYILPPGAQKEHTAKHAKGIKKKYRPTKETIKRAKSQTSARTHIKATLDKETPGSLKFYDITKGDRPIHKGYGKNSFVLGGRRRTGLEPFEVQRLSMKKTKEDKHVYVRSTPKSVEKETDRLERRAEYPHGKDYKEAQRRATKHHGMKR